MPYCETLAAPTVVANSATPGEPIDPGVSPSFPAATATKSPAATRRLTAMLLLS